MLPEGDESPEKVTYQAASPDEAALVTAAKNFGFFFYRFLFPDTFLLFQYNERYNKKLIIHEKLEVVAIKDRLW